MPRDDQTLKNFFDANALLYESRIVPAFQQFATALLQSLQPQAHEHVLDVGTGTGIVARLIAPQVKNVIGIDFAPRMIAEANQNRPPNVIFQEADVHDLPFEQEQFHRVVSSFGLNATHPRKAFAQIYRVLKPGGSFTFHEWNELHPLDEKIIDVFARYMLEDADAPPDLFATRECVRTPRIWDNVLQEADDFDEVLSETGFVELHIAEESVEITLPVAAFMDYKLAWANRQAELAAMDSYTRADCLDAIRALLHEHADLAGNVCYAPKLFRVHARKH